MTKDGFLEDTLCIVNNCLIKKSSDLSDHHSVMGRMADTTAVWNTEQLSYGMLQDELYCYVKDRSYNMFLFSVLGNKYQCSRTETFEK